MTISERFKTYLFYSKKNVTQLADEIGVTQSALNRVVKGEVLPSSKVLIPLGNLGVNINWLLLGNGEMMQDEETIRKDNNTIIKNSQLTNSNNTNTDIIQTIEDSNIKHLKAEIKTLKTENKFLKKEIKAEQASKQLLKDSKAVLENQIKDKDMIISLLQKN
ncbi:helix-turn-helix domain-containing protein [Aureispira anguillae]|uniref:Helix-turn-helix domain-containing protein n=1 Tax=Aureispira anguillae TaxID=2864201 RepID=A0A915YH31_9BACT|nr:helix-turn-helix domain-containing protein [Aureispira anguillae]BDS13034.1 helix-turn-helix domain-containing protein [Aureispira anguillae]